MPPLVAIDARDAAGPALRGWGRYTSRLLGALQGGVAGDLELEPLMDGGPGPEVLFEQVKLPLALRARRAALVHSTNCFLPLVRPCPGVVTIHDLAFEAWRSDFVPSTRVKYRLFTRLAARSANRVICVSGFTRDDLCQRYGVNPGKVRVIPLAPALAATGEERLPGREQPASGREELGGPYILAVGDLRQKKNLAPLVRAIVALRRRAGIPHRLVLAGADAGEGSRLRAIAGRDPIELTGYVSDRRLDALIRGAELLVHPGPYEGFGLALLEAMARGTPVLAARSGALPETGGDGAAYFEPGQEGDLERVLGELVGDPQRRAQLSRSGLRWVERFSWERTAAQTAAVYRELL